MTKAIAAMATIVVPLFADPASTLGSSGGFTDGWNHADAVRNMEVLKAAGVGSTRIANYAYWDKWTTNTLGDFYKGLDSLALLGHQYNIRFQFLFEFYSDWNFGLGGYGKWDTIGQAFAGRYKPNSAWWLSNNIHDYGISDWAAMNEPDVRNDIDKTAYHEALRGLAHGVHAADPSGRVIPGGFASPNAVSNYTCNGYAQAIADLLNDGTLDGIDLHTYNSVWAPLCWYWKSSQHDFDAVKQACGITRNIGFYSTEFNYNRIESEDILVSQGTGGTPVRTTEEVAACRLLTQFWDNLGVVGNDGKPVGRMALAFQLYDTDTNSSWQMSTSLSPWTPSARGAALRLVAQLTKGMAFTSLDPKAKGEFTLEGNGRKMWVWQDRSSWTDHPADSFAVTGIPSSATKLEIYGWDGLRSTITLSNKTSYTVKNLPQDQTYMFIANAAGVTAAQPFQRSAVAERSVPTRRPMFVSMHRANQASLRAVMMDGRLTLNRRPAPGVFLPTGRQSDNCFVNP